MGSLVALGGQGLQRWPQAVLLTQDCRSDLTAFRMAAAGAMALAEYESAWVEVEHKGPQSLLLLIMPVLDKPSLNSFLVQIKSGSQGLSNFHIRAKVHLKMCL